MRAAISLLPGRERDSAANSSTSWAGHTRARRTDKVPALQICQVPNTLCDTSDRPGPPRTGTTANEKVK
jgi:hypothetical protein